MRPRLVGSALVLVLAAAVLATGCSLRGDEPEGSDILFVRETAQGAAVYLMPHDVGEARRLVEGTAPRWSPDGARFAYLVNEDDRTLYFGTSIWVMNHDTGGKRRLVRGDRNAGGIQAFAWAPDGVRLAYSTGQQIVVVDTETGDSELVSLELSADGPLDWSSDGRELLVSYPGAVVILDLRTGAARPVAPRRLVSGGRWSADGERVAYVQQNASWNPKRRAFDVPAGRWTSSVVVAERDGRNPQFVTDGEWDSEPVWSADGSQIYFSRSPASKLLGSAPDDEESEIYAVDLETRELRRITDDTVRDRWPDARPARRSLPGPPRPVSGDVVVPDLVGRQVLVSDERRRLEKLGLGLEVVLIPPENGMLAIVREQAPVGGSRVPVGRVVTINVSDLASFYSGRRFSAPVWKAHPECGKDSPRRKMYSDLVRHVLRRGMTRERVFSLLGEPQRSNGRTVDWALSQLSWVPVDCIYVRVEFDRSGRATRFYQSQR